MVQFATGQVEIVTKTQELTEEELIRVDAAMLFGGVSGGFPRSGDPLAPRDVIRGAYSQRLRGVVGVHWLRFSLERIMQDAPHRCRGE